MTVRIVVEAVKSQTYWKNHYVVEGDADEIERHISVRTFFSEGHPFDLLCFIYSTDMPNVLISPGSGGHSYDPDFDRWYPLSHVMSLLSTPPPGNVSDLRIPTMFIVGDRGPTPAYIRALYERLPLMKKRLYEVEGSVYWRLSHPSKAAEIVCEWFDQTVREGTT